MTQLAVTEAWIRAYPDLNIESATQDCTDGGLIVASTGKGGPRLIKLDPEGEQVYAISDPRSGFGQHPDGSVFPGPGQSNSPLILRAWDDDGFGFVTGDAFGVSKW